MSNSAIIKIEKLYDEIQRSFCIEPGHPGLAEATQFYTNHSRPIHRWFHFKEGFAANLLTAAAINTAPLADEDAIFVDPFCGTGTTLLAGDTEYEWRARRIGLEINPFLSFVTQTKTNWRRYDPTRLNRLAQKVLAMPLRKNIPIDSWPELSTLRNPEIFSPRKVSALIDLISRIDRLTEPERDLLRLGVAAAAEELGYYRKDGRALRILRDADEIERRRRLSVKTVVQGLWRTYEDDLRTMWKKCGQAASECTVLRGDGRAILLPESSQISPGQATLIAYSPPYLNHIDYTEVYKVELWLLGFITKRQDMLALRKQTLRSHASITFKADGIGLPTNVTEIIETAASTIEATGKEWHKHFRDTAFGYLQDIRQSLSRQYELLRPGGQAVCVVANSAHGSGSNRVPIAIDLLIAWIAQNLGFEAQRLSVARQMRRRDSLNRYLRETVLVIRRPES